MIIIFNINWFFLVGKYMTGKAVPPSAPTITSGIYWGYTVRMADSFSDVFTNSPHKVR